MVDYDVKTDPNTDLSYADTLDAGRIATPGGRDEFRRHGAENGHRALMLLTLYSPQGTYDARFLSTTRISIF